MGDGAGARDRALAEQLGLRLRGVVLLLRRLTADEEITTQQLAVLGSLERGGRRMTELADEHGVRLPTMTALVKRLERDGLIRRGRDASDARVVTVELTERGGTGLRTARDRRTAILAARIGALPDEERAALEAALPALDRLFHGP
ncbi:MarR family winged helix-turn-helix transcriptional regulator [Actinomadura flavalba]|uniref:MarR family winged helix-turn-helix transcriptional regulator n=1 Tax=Actinomadura flavalba TaxID=1120938 RepID=UPI000370127D|nr:MarR family transcriptional regulator [Actinomadura flavalba]